MKLTFLISLILASSTLFSQHESVLEIRSYYKDIKTMLKDEKIIEARNVKFISITERQGDTLCFWYFDKSSKDNKRHLFLVTHSTKTDGTSTTNEYLFKDDKVVFYLDKMQNKNIGFLWEYRFYFDDSHLIRFMNGGQILSYDSDYSSVLYNGKGLQDQFLSMTQDQ